MGSPRAGNSDADRAAALGTDSSESDLGGNYAPPKLVIPSMTMGGETTETI
jgi:hypothetical protein